jgi:hypothetical protein
LETVDPCPEEQDCETVIEKAEKEDAMETF